jgi:hypothetical protein
MALQEEVPDSPRNLERTPLARSVGLALFSGFCTQPNSPVTPSHGRQSGRKRPRTLVPGLAQMQSDNDADNDEVVRLRAQVRRLEDELRSLRARLRSTALPRGPRPGATTMVASMRTQTSPPPPGLSRSGPPKSPTPRPNQRASARKGKAPAPARAVSPAPPVAMDTSVAPAAVPAGVVEEGDEWTTVTPRRARPTTSRSYAAVAASSGAAPSARPAVTTGVPDPAVMALAASLRSRAPRKAAGGPHKISRLYVPLKKATYGSLRASLRKLGLDTARIPEIRFVGQSLAELWIHDEVRVAFTDRLRACGLTPIAFNPCSPNSFRDHGGATSRDVAAARLRAERLFAGRLASVVASCSDDDVREAAKRLLAALPPEARSAPPPSRTRASGARPSNAPRQTTPGPSRLGAPRPSGPAAPGPSRPAESGSNAPRPASDAWDASAPGWDSQC